MRRMFDATVIVMKDTDAKGIESRKFDDKRDRGRGLTEDVQIHFKLTLVQSS